MESSQQKFDGVLEYMRDREQEERSVRWIAEFEPNLDYCKVCRYQSIRDAKIATKRYVDSLSEVHAKITGIMPSVSESDELSHLRLYAFTRLWADVRISAENGCLGCRILTLAILHFDKGARHRNFRIEFSPSETSLSVLVRPVGGFDGPELNFMLYYPPGHEGTQLLGPLEAPRGKLWQPVPRKDYSNESIDFVRTQLKHCMKRHAGCKQRTYSPRRLLDVSKPENWQECGDSVRLVEPTEAWYGHYLALSHCWGKKPMLTTTTENKVHRMAGIPLDYLPRTFYDAVCFARILHRLHVRYLWIDSLCIIQDDVEDWAVQSSEMAQIYSGAVMTIAASSAEDGSAGLFAKRSPLSQLVKIEDPVEAGTVHQVVCTLKKGVQKMDHIHTMYETLSLSKDQLPLLRRAWTFQERLLSTRTVHFTPLEMLFECKTEMNCQCSSVPKFSIHRTVFQHTKQNKVSVCGTGGQVGSISEVETSPAEEWNQLAEVYTRLQLTFYRDIFPALSGLAREVCRKAEKQGIILGPYCAGLWGNHLPLGLCWWPNYSTPTDDEYYAPSWSWASKRGISWRSYDPDKAKNFSADDQFRLVSMNAVQESPDAFGQLREGSSITIRANIVPSIELGDLSEISSTDHGVHYELPSTAGVINEKSADREEFYISSYEPGLYIFYDLEKADEERVYTEKMLDYYCIELQRHTPMLLRERGSTTPVLEIEGILVQKVVVPPPPPSEDTYRRIGNFYYRGPATPFGYNFDIESYRSTFEEMAEETDEETEEHDEWNDHWRSEESDEDYVQSDEEYEKSREWYEQKVFDRQRRLDQRRLDQRKKKPRPWNEKEVEKQHAKVMQRSWKERQMQDRNKQRYKDAWSKDIEYKQIILI